MKNLKENVCNLECICYFNLSDSYIAALPPFLVTSYRLIVDPRPKNLEHDIYPCYRLNK